MPLNVKPVKLRDSLYLLIPVDIARLVGVGSSSSFLLSLNENPDSIRLVYEMKKGNDPDQGDNSRNSGKE